MKAKITFEHDRRRETYPYAREAVREAVYNAIIHNCYMFGSPIQIRIEDDAMIISNCCILPEGWTVDTFMEPHNSRPYNPDIANVFYRAGYIEHWGRGIQKICDACKELGAEPPVYELLGNGLRVHFKALASALIDEAKTPKVHDEPIDEPKENLLNEKIIRLLRNEPNITYDELVVETGVSRSTIKRAIGNLAADGLVKRIGGKRYGHWEINE